MDEIILDFISEYVKELLNDKKVSEIKWEVLRGRLIDEVANISQFDDLTIKELLILYKINRLEDFKIVTSDTANDLRELFYIQRDLNKRMKDLVVREDKQEELYLIIREYIKIENEFDKYHLLDSAFDLKKIVNCFIKTDKYFTDDKMHRR